jgi:hypothetical protein
MFNDVGWLVVGIIGLVDSRAGWAAIAIFAAVRIAGLHP